MESSLYKLEYDLTGKTRLRENRFRQEKGEFRPKYRSKNLAEREMAFKGLPRV